jgi:hypothetical protein
MTGPLIAIASGFLILALGVFLARFVDNREDEHGGGYSAARHVVDDDGADWVAFD